MHTLTSALNLIWILKQAIRCMWAMSPDGQNFYGNSQSGPLGEWITNTYSFRSYPSYTGVYVAFAFNSHTDPQGLGAFIRNVRLTG